VFDHAAHSMSPYLKIFKNAQMRRPANNHKLAQKSNTGGQGEAAKLPFHPSSHRCGNFQLFC
jgi:hypothetical protein